MLQQLPEPGVHLDVPASVYHSWDLCSLHRLRDLARSPAHCRWSIDNPSSTPAMVLGSAVHDRVLLPRAFDSLWAVSSLATRRSKAWDEFVAENVTKGVLTAPEGEQVEAMARAVHEHPIAARLLADSEAKEVSVVAPLYDIVSKGRVDAVNSRLSVLVDLKTTTDASEEAFTRAIFRYGYHQQAAMYLGLLAALQGEFSSFAFIVVALEKEPPYGVNVFRLADDAVDQGRSELQPLFEKYKECVKSGVWCGYDLGVKDIGLPRWAKNREVDYENY